MDVWILLTWRGLSPSGILQIYFIFFVWYVFLLRNTQHMPIDIWLQTNILSQFSACCLDNSGLLCPHVSSKLSGKVHTSRGSGSTKQTATQDLVEGHTHDFESGTWPPGSCFVPLTFCILNPLPVSVFLSIDVLSTDSIKELLHRFWKLLCLFRGIFIVWSLWSVYLLL